jgi:glycosyltransferase involved in cell wall biosynthesis
MKVCFIAGTLARGGAEKQLVYMLRALCKAGIQARVLCLTENEYYAAEIKSLGVEIEWTGQSNNRLVRLLRIIRSLRRERADIIQSSHFYTNIYAALAAKAAKIPGIGAIRNNLQSELNGHKALGRFQLSLPHLLIANSESARRRAIERGVSPQNIEFVRNVVDSGERHSKIPLKDGQFITFLFAGRLCKQKRPDRFVRFAAALVQKFPARPLRFQIAGHGVLRNEIEEQAKNCALLSNKIEFLGDCPAMSEIYRRADALVLTSDYEGTPNVVLEAMAYALPVIATKVGGVPEILDDKCGILVDPKDETGLVEAASELVENPEARLRLGSEGLKYIKNNHSLDRLTEHLPQIYSGLIYRFGNESDSKQASARKTSIG